MSSLGSSSSEHGPARDWSAAEDMDGQLTGMSAPTFATGGHIPLRASDPIRLTGEPRGRRRGGNDRMVLAIALVISSIIMAACCIAGLAVYNTAGL
jgi:hypothetical protein